MNAVLLSILTTTGATVLSDLIGYARARQQWRDNQSSLTSVVCKPTFDWTLFGTRAAIGVITGGLTGLGIHNVANAQGGL